MWLSGIPAVAVAALLSAPVLALAQDEGTRQRSPGTSSGGGAPRTAVPRDAPAPPPPSPPAPRATAPVSGGATTQRGVSSRPADREPRVAVPRGAQPVPPPVGAPPLRIIGGYPRWAYPYGYGGFGLGYFYYDPYVWYGPGRFSGYGYGYPTGEVRLRVQPRDAEVFVDGYYAGIVDDFDGVFQALRLEEGPYAIEIVAPGYEPLEVRLRIQPGRKMTYRGELTPLAQTAPEP